MASTPEKPGVCVGGRTLRNTPQRMMRASLGARVNGAEGRSRTKSSTVSTSGKENRGNHTTSLDVDRKYLFGEDEQSRSPENNDDSTSTDVDRNGDLLGEDEQSRSFETNDDSASTQTDTSKTVSFSVPASCIYNTQSDSSISDQSVDEGNGSLSSDESILLVQINASPAMSSDESVENQALDDVWQFEESLLSELSSESPPGSSANSEEAEGIEMDYNSSVKVDFSCSDFKENEVSAMKLKNDELQSRLNDLEEEGALTKAKNKRLAVECNVLSDENAQLKGRIADLEGREATLKDNLDQVIDENNTRESNLRASYLKVDDCREELEAKNAALWLQVEAVSEERDGIAKARAELLDQCIERSGDLDVMADYVIFLEEERDFLSAKNDESEAFLNTLTDEKAALQANAKAIQDENDRLTSNVSTLTTENDRLVEHCGRLGSQLNEANAQIKDLEEELMNLRQGEDDDSSNEGAEEDDTFSYAYDSDVDDDLEGLTAERNHLRQELKDASAEISLLKDAKSSLMASKGANEDAFTLLGLRKENNALEGKVKSLEVEKERLVTENYAYLREQLLMEDIMDPQILKRQISKLGQRLTDKKHLLNFCILKSE